MKQTDSIGSPVLTIKQLSEAVKLHKKVIPRRQSIQILQNVRVSVNGNLLKIQSTNLETELETRHIQSLAAQEPFARIVEISELATALEVLDKKAVASLSLVNGKLVIYGDGEKVVLATADSDKDFPNLDFKAGTESVTSEWLQRIIEAKEFAASLSTIHSLTKSALTRS
jgi:DNA polymerase III sliding clamp (beta) subunit (PCNA family)